MSFPFSFWKAAAGGGGSTPIGWWKLNEGTGTTTADSSTGGTNTGTLTGTVTWTTGPNSTNAVTLDGSTGYIDVANASNFARERTDPFTLTCWIKANSSLTGTKGVINKQQQTGNQPGIDFRYDADNTRIRCSLIQADASVIGASSANGSVSKNAWHFVAATYDGSSNGTGLKVYVDNGSATAGSGTLTQSIANTHQLWIGRNQFFFWGDIDDARFYTSELSAAEISALYSGGAK